MTTNSRIVEVETELHEAKGTIATLTGELALLKSQLATLTDIVNATAKSRRRWTVAALTNILQILTNLYLARNSLSRPSAHIANISWRYCMLTRPYSDWIQYEKTDQSRAQGSAPSTSDTCTSDEGPLEYQDVMQELSRLLCTNLELAITRLKQMVAHDSPFYSVTTWTTKTDIALDHGRAFWSAVLKEYGLRDDINEAIVESILLMDGLTRLPNSHRIISAFVREPERRELHFDGQLLLGMTTSDLFRLMLRDRSDQGRQKPRSTQVPEHKTDQVSRTLTSLFFSSFFFFFG